MKKQKQHEEKVETTLDDVQNETIETSENLTVEEQDTNDASAQIEELTQKCAELNDKNLRSLKERSELIKTAGESLLANMLPLVDDFERGLKATETSEDVQAIKEGVDLIYNKFISFLTQNGIKAIPTENETFDTDLHEAITTFPAPTEELKGKIIDCVAKGYTLNEKVIRFSKVVVGE